MLVDGRTATVMLEDGKDALVWCATEPIGQRYLLMPASTLVLA